MTIPAGKAPILHSVRAAAQTWRLVAPRLFPLCLMGGALIVLFLLLAASGAAFLLVMPLLIIAFIYTSFMSAALDLPMSYAARFRAALSVAASMGIIGFFLFVVFLVGGMPGANIFAEAANIDLESIPPGDMEAAMAAMQNALTANPGLAAGIVFFYAAVWHFLTSRLYVAAPASAAENRIRTFETWTWTKDNMLRITAMRLILVTPPFVIFNFAAPALLQAIADAPMALIIAVHVAVQTAVLVVAWGLEACLSAYLYRGLKPPSQPR